MLGVDQLKFEMQVGVSRNCIARPSPTREGDEAIYIAESRGFPHYGLGWVAVEYLPGDVLHGGAELVYE